MTSAPYGGACCVVLVDSTIWIDLLRGRQTAIVGRLRRLIDAGEAAAAPVIAQEVLQGAANAAALATLRRYFLAIPLLGADQIAELHIAAGELYARAGWQAVTPRSPSDCLVAVTAIFENVPLLHDDRDFDQLASVEPRLRLVPR